MGVSEDPGAPARGPGGVQATGMCSFSMLLSLGCAFRDDVGIHGTAGVICPSLLGGILVQTGAEA